MDRVRGERDFQRLEVYRKSLDVVERADRVATGFTGAWRHLGWQLARAASSVSLNIAEGSGRFRRDDKAHYYAIATGSAMECIAVLDIAERLDLGPPRPRQELRALLNDIVPMLVALSRSVRARPGP